MSGQTPLIKTPETPVIAALQLWAIVRTWYETQRLYKACSERSQRVNCRGGFSRL